MALDVDTRKRTSRPPRGPGVARPPGKDARPDEGAILAIVRAEHGDPFGFLGPHQVGPDLWEIRAMLPEARAAFVEVNEKSIPMERRHEAGFFVGRVEGAFRPTYRLRIDTGEREIVRED